MKKKVNLNKEGTITKEVRSNPWIVSTLVLGIFCLIFIIGSIPLDIEKLTKVQVNSSICSQIRATPSWIDEKGKITEGYMEFNNQSPSYVVDRLIEENIYFIRRAGCGWCEKQIQWFGDSWIKYYDSGLTINC